MAMTEKQWLRSKNSVAMIEALYDMKASERKMLLFICACGRCLEGPKLDEDILISLRRAEQYADGQISFEKFMVAQNFSHRVAMEVQNRGDLFCQYFLMVVDAVVAVAIKDLDGPFDAADVLSENRDESYVADLIREIFGNPFRPLPIIEPSWLRWQDELIPKSAKQIYEKKMFADLPVVADMLEEVGCTDLAIVNHCRSPGPHVRGCWVIDLLLGKK